MSFVAPSQNRSINSPIAVAMAGNTNPLLLPVVLFVALINLFCGEEDKLFKVEEEETKGSPSPNLPGKTEKEGSDLPPSSVPL